MFFILFFPLTEKMLYMNSNNNNSNKNSKLKITFIVRTK